MSILPRTARAVLVAAVVANFLVISLRSTHAQTSYTWISDLSGNWNDTSRWQSGAVANGAGATALFTPTGTGELTVTLDVNRILGNLTFTSSRKVKIDGNGKTLTLETSGIKPVIDVSGEAELLLALLGNQGFEKRGAGTLTIGGATSTYSGSTIITGGVLEAEDGEGLSSNSNLVLDGGTFRSGTSFFVRSLGTGAGEVQWTGDGGIDGNVQLNGGLTLTWGVGGFVPLGSKLTFAPGSDATNFYNNIDLNAGQRTIEVGTGAVFLTGGFLNGAVTNGSLVKQGSGLLALGNMAFSTASALTINAGALAIIGSYGGDITNNSTLVLTSDFFLTSNTLSAAIHGPGEVISSNYYAGQSLGGFMAVRLTGNNDYTGDTWIDGLNLYAIDGVGLSAASNLILQSGLLETNGMFTRAVGSGPGMVRWDEPFPGVVTQAGFAAVEGDLVVNLGGLGQTLVWGQAGFVPSASVLSLATGGPYALSGGHLDFRNPVDLNNGTRTVSADDFFDLEDEYIEMSRPISNGRLVVSTGRLYLTGANTFAGGLEIAEGAVVVAADGVGLPTASNLMFNSDLNVAALQTSGTFTRALGSGPNEVTWNGGSGGFVARNADLTVNLGGAQQTLVWGSTHFVGADKYLILSAEGTTSTRLNFRNPIDLAGGARTIYVRPRSDWYDQLRGYVELSGTVSNGVLVKNGPGTLLLSADNNLSEIRIENGALRGTDGGGVPANTIVTLVNGVWETSGSITRPLGIGTGAVRWQADEFGGNGFVGFSAFGGPLTVNLGGSGATFPWGTSFFNPGGVQLNTTLSTDKTTLVNGFDLGGAQQDIFVPDNPDDADDFVEITGALGNGGLMKSGEGRLVLTGQQSLQLGKSVYAGTLVYDGSAQLDVTGNVYVGSQSTLIVTASSAVGGYGSIDVSGTFVNNSDQWNADAEFTVYSGGTLSGTGTNGATTLRPGSTLSPGNSVGRVDFSDLTINSLVTDPTVVVFEFHNADGNAPGSDWDLIVVDNLVINATAADPLTVRIDSWISATGGHGANDFVTTNSYSWLWIDAQSVTLSPGGGDLDDRFVFVDDAPGAGLFGTNNPYGTRPVGYGFYVTQSGPKLLLNYGLTAVPEPGSLALACVAGCVGLAARRRKKTAAEMAN